MSDSESPILLLPPEITATIFGYCLASDRQLPSPHEAPLLLAQICRQWREICLDTPDLWASISFGHERSIELLRLWLSRARSHSLSLFLRTMDEASACIFMQVTMPYCSQWQDVDLTLSFSALRHLSMASFPRLERLTLTHFGNRQSTEPVIIRDAPLLRYAKIKGLPHLKVDVPLDQLTTLHYEAFIGQTQAIAVLRYCPNLLDLSCLLTVGGRNVAPPVELHFLRSLRILNVSILHCLTVPRLEQLEIYAISDAATVALRSLVSRSSCDLQLLILGAGRATVARMQSFLSVANSIAHLHLNFSSADPAWFENQILTLQGADVLPRLKHLEILENTGGGDHDHYRPLLDVLWWRRRHSALGMFKLLLTTDGACIPPADVAEFRALAEAGLQVQLTTRAQGSLVDTWPA